MQIVLEKIALELPDEMAAELSGLPADRQGALLSTWIGLLHQRPAKDTAVAKPAVNDLPFATLPSRGVVVTDDFVNQLRMF